MRSQGLPMNFIVIAIMVILVLVIVSMLFLSGSGQTQAFDRQSVVNTCDSACFFENQISSKNARIGYTRDNSEYCSKTFEIKGMSGTKKCPDLSVCELTFKDGSKCTAKCTETTLECQT